MAFLKRIHAVEYRKMENKEGVTAAAWLLMLLVVRTNSLENLPDRESQYNVHPLFKSIAIRHPFLSWLYVHGCKWFNRFTSAVLSHEEVNFWTRNCQFSYICRAICEKGKGYACENQD